MEIPTHEFSDVVMEICVASADYFEKFRKDQAAELSAIKYIQANTEIITELSEHVGVSCYIIKCRFDLNVHKSDYLLLKTENDLFMKLVEMFTKVNPNYQFVSREAVLADTVAFGEETEYRIHIEPYLVVRHD